jgi:hypothetical protein
MSHLYLVMQIFASHPQILPRVPLQNKSSHAYNPLQLPAHFLHLPRATALTAAKEIDLGLLRRHSSIAHRPLSTSPAFFGSLGRPTTPHRHRESPHIAEQDSIDSSPPPSFADVCWVTPPPGALIWCPRGVAWPTCDSPLIGSMGATVQPRCFGHLPRFVDVADSLPPGLFLCRCVDTATYRHRQTSSTLHTRCFRVFVKVNFALIF